MKRILWVLACVTMTALIGSCRTSPPGPRPVHPSQQELAGLPLQFIVQLQVIELKEELSAGDALFPAPGFRLQDGVVVPVEEPGTLAGLELTPEQYGQWAEKLKAAHAELYLAPGFTLWPGRPSETKENTEIPYIGNWLFRDRAGSPQRRTVRREIAVSLLATLLAGRTEALMNVNVSWNMARLREFQLLPAGPSGGPPSCTGRNQTSIILEKTHVQGTLFLCKLFRHPQE